MLEIKEIEKIIYGRIEPHIYAFKTNLIPNYLKIGDTYRPVQTRIKEWKEHFPDLTKEFEYPAVINDKTFFRDHAIHKFLEDELSKHRLEQSDISNELYYSKEFFEDTDVIDVEKALLDIKKDYENQTGKYNFYDVDTQLSVRTIYSRDEDWKLRPNQEIVVNNFWNAYHNNHRTNLLMYAVMRFGKSFTALSCAKKMDASIVVVVSAKADVKNEWKKTVEKPLVFDGYEFLTADDLIFSNHVIKDKIDSNKKVVIFLTLQDLQGDSIKEKHKELLSSDIDMLLVDETHFGARAEKYGAILRDSLKEITDEEDIDVDEANKIISKHLKSKVCIHLSGTPYRVLMTSEFSKEDIIAFCQFSDIVDAQNEWDYKNSLKEFPKEEWENPYYGFPQMIRFAFNPSQKTREKIAKLHEMGISTSFSDIFRPKSIKVDSNGEYKKFVYEDEVLDLLEIIDGSKKDENILSFLDYDKIKDGKLCQNIVVVLPYCSSCDAFEELINQNKSKFKNLNTYEIINISGSGTSNKYKTTDSVKEKIKECSNNGVKTITLTVNRMLTGSTVEEWDTMIYLKDTSSPQDYDQSIFRLQNQYIKKYISDNGDIIKYNNKPQTLLIDFNPNRMFYMQEEKSKIYNVNVDKSGNSKLKERLLKELSISPIIVMNKNKMLEIEAVDIMNAVSNYSNSKGVVDETNEIPVDLKLLNIDEIRTVISNQAELGSKKGLSLFNTEELSNGDFDFDNYDTDIQDVNQDGINDNLDNEQNNQVESATKEEQPSYEKKFRTYYARLLFYSFLTKSNVNSLEDLLLTMNNDDNKRIARNLSINPKIIKLIIDNMNPFITSKLDYKIQNINKLSFDEETEPINRVIKAMQKFGKLSDNEIVTPNNIALEVVNNIGIDAITNIINNNGRILDIASKEAEFAVAIYNIIKDKCDNNIVKNAIYSVTTSSIAYEFTRKVYEILELNINNISEKFYSYDLLNVDKENIIDLMYQNKKFSDIELEYNLLYMKGNDNMKFDLVIGNPPYQKNIGDTSDDPIYNEFMDISYLLSDKSCLITPAKFLFNAGKTPKEWNKKMLNDEHFKVFKYYQNSSDVFNDITFTGGVAISYYDKNKKFGKIGTYLPYKELESILRKVLNSNFKSLSDIIYSPESYKFSDLLHVQNPDVVDKLSSGHKYDIVTNIFSKLPNIFVDTIDDKKSYVAFVGLSGRNRVTKYIREDYIKQHNNLKYYKVFLPKSNGSGAIGEVIPTPLIGDPILAEKNYGHTQSFISIGKFSSKEEAIALLKYIKTKFARALLGTLKVTQDNKKDTWSNVPIQDFSNKSDIDWTKTTKEIDNQLYNKYKLSKEEIAFIEENIKEID